MTVTKSDLEKLLSTVKGKRKVLIVCHENPALNGYAVPLSTRKDAQPLAVIIRTSPRNMLDLLLTPIPKCLIIIVLYMLKTCTRLMPRQALLTLLYIIHIRVISS